MSMLGIEQVVVEVYRWDGYITLVMSAAWIRKACLSDVPFTSLTVLVGWREGHPLSPKDFWECGPTWTNPRREEWLNDKSQLFKSTMQCYASWSRCCKQWGRGWGMLSVVELTVGLSCQHLRLSACCGNKMGERLRWGSGRKCPCFWNYPNYLVTQVG